MLKVGSRKANLHFSKYLKLVREGQEIVVTERGNPYCHYQAAHERGDTGR